jgi:formylglycine-generating enzyme required for sulfatase activity/serine/threonine protein kinase
MPEPNLSAGAIPSGRAYEILEDNSSFGDYVILRCLAYDMLGSLYLVQKNQGGQRETLFVFPTMVAQDKEFHDRFLKQSKKLCTLNHPNLLNFQRPQIISSCFCLSGEPFEGLSIPDHLMMLTGSQLSVSDKSQTFNLPPAQVTPILEQVLAGLAHAHESRVLHLNLNPTKILRSAYGEIKIYGCHFLEILGQELFEVLVSAGIPPLKLDPNRSYLGTTDVLSPEARLRHTVEYRSDLYALGVDTHWLLTGRKPTSPYQPPSKIIPHLEAGWDAFIIRSLQRKPEDRYASAEVMLSELRNHAQLEPVTGGKPLELILAPDMTPPPTPATKRKSAEGAAPKKAKPVKPPRKPRGPLTPHQRLLLFVLPALLIVAGMAYIFVVVMTADDELDVSSSITVRRAKEGKTPHLRLTIMPRNAMVTFNPGKNIFQVSDGELPVNILKGEYNIEIESPQHRTQRIPYKVTDEADHLFINLEPAWDTVDFVTVPGATIRALPDHGNPIYLGVAPDDGILHVTRGLAQGDFTFEATKENYHPISIADQHLDYAKTYRFELKPIAEPSHITLVSDPPGATVLLDGRALGQTPLTTDDLPVDTDLTLTLEQQGYRPAVRTIRIAPSANEEINLGNLSAKTGALALAYTVVGRAPTPEDRRDTKITINDLTYPGSLRQLPNMLEGGYSVTFQNPSYFPATQNIIILDGQTTTVSVDLTPRPARLFIQPNPAVPITVSAGGQLLAPAADGAYEIPPARPVDVQVQAQNYAGTARESWAVPLQVIPGPQTGQNYVVPYLGLTLNWIPPGNFTMGSPESEDERKPSEGPPTTVIIPVGFWAGRYDVTQDEYRAVMGENPSEFGQGASDQGRYPVESVSWTKAVEFARLVNEREQAAHRVPAGYEYRLPTEAEWEYFARAGTTTPFSFGASASSINGNFRGIYPRSESENIPSEGVGAGTKPVGSYPPNPWGLYDVHGNVSEWMLDVYKSRLPGDQVTAPDLQTGDPDDRHGFRGGSWTDYAADCRSAWRDDGGRPDSVSNSIGFRLVLAPKIQP